jgi:hypothetical protein
MNERGETVAFTGMGPSRNPGQSFRRRLPAVAAAFLISLPVGAQSPMVAELQFKEWKACVMAKAERYLKSPDSAEVSARVALLACKAEANKFLDGMIAERVDPGQRRSLTDGLERRLTDEATVFIMEHRTR